MAIRKGSLDGLLREVDEGLAQLLLEDYAISARRDHCSRGDFAAGYVALARRIRSGDLEVLNILKPQPLTTTSGL
jgi:hypothetical protein